MATNEVFRNADHLTLPVVAGTVSGDPVIVGALAGVAQTNRETGEVDATVWLTGAYKLTVDGATAVGQKVYYVGDGTTRNTILTTAADSGGTTPVPNTLFGHALETKTAAAAVITVRVARI